ncbi:hypothetical protein B566_EDAN016768 [Ephemera danica]|nr:hypothetical protein B566_EDAN016768 [Ephemera danica]
MALLPYVMHNLQSLSLQSAEPDDVSDMRWHADEHGFQVNLDVQHFKPGEVTVKLQDASSILVEARHDELVDHHGFISRHFKRRYQLPECGDVDAIQCDLSCDAILTITIPKKTMAMETDERTVPIIMTGCPAVMNAEFAPSLVSYAGENTAAAAAAYASTCSCS